MRGGWISLGAVSVVFALPVLIGAAEPQEIDFNRDIRPILSNKCFFCHGPDPAQRKGGTDGLRLDTLTGATADLGGHAAIVPGKPEASAVIARVLEADPDLVMPPKSTGKTLTDREKELLAAWIKQGAHFAKHWSYIPPERPALPVVKQENWPRTALDRFILARLEAEGLAPLEEADRFALIRRVSLDITGLPPTLAEVEQFVADQSPDAYERMVDRYLEKPTYGEHWARMWLDLARYADSAGYADDPSRTIWAYRDYVIRALNRNISFEQFTLEQIAGDLLPEPTEDQLIATAFHRNTLTNSEGGTNDEEFRSVAVVDRVNTTLATWMGTTINCCQCHHHKYDPISQEEFFQLYAFFNQSEDADLRDERPLLDLWTTEQLDQKKSWQTEIAQLEQTLKTVTPALRDAATAWEAAVPKSLAWQTLGGEFASKAGVAAKRLDDGSWRVDRSEATDTFTLTIPLTDAGSLTALQLESLPDAELPGQGAGFGGGNFVLSRVSGTIHPPAGTVPRGRFVRIELPGKEKILSFAEVQVFQGAENLALKGAATQSSTDFNGPATLAMDGNTDGNYNVGSTTHTAISDNPWWEIDLKAEAAIDRIVLWNRTDGDIGGRISGYKISVLNDERATVWEQSPKDVPKPSSELAPSGVRTLPLVAAFADYSQSGFDAATVLNPKDPAKQGWAVGGQHQQPHRLTLATSGPVEYPAGSSLVVQLEFVSPHAQHTLGRFRLSSTADPKAAEWGKLPAAILATLNVPAEQRTDAQRTQLLDYFLTIAPELAAERKRLAEVKKQLAEIKPFTTVPVMKDLAGDKLRITKLQYRGNFLDLGPEQHEGVPQIFHSLPDGAPKNRLTLAHWLVDRRNPLTARVIVNRFWEQIFGTGIVATSEEFGSQGELPFHPELLDWLAVDFMEGGWDMKRLIKQLVMSAAYRQSSKVTPELVARDPDNRLLARGPRFRMSAEMVRDQALAVSGLLSLKSFGPPVRPPQPKLGLAAAFGSGVDWQTSTGEDKYRRGLYTTWRRSSPYPSMATFDAPNREVCTIRRPRTNTPLQALVTLNDPVYMEAAQALSRMVVKEEANPEKRAKRAFMQCLTRPPTPYELERVTGLYELARTKLSASPTQAEKLATIPLGPAPDGSDLTELAAWTIVASSLLNLDEMFMRR